MVRVGSVAGLAREEGGGCKVTGERMLRRVGSSKLSVEPRLTRLGSMSSHPSRLSSTASKDPPPRSAWYLDSGVGVGSSEGDDLQRILSSSAPKRQVPAPHPTPCAPRRSCARAGREAAGGVDGPTDKEWCAGVAGSGLVGRGRRQGSGRADGARQRGAAPDSVRPSQTATADAAVW
eukprot:2494465-Rhodomonas_salina.1